jgi:alpha-beta hydrolase superfamily lysophospholipase
MTISSLAIVLRLALLLLLGFAAVCLLFYWRQEKMYFFPEQASLEQVEGEARAAGFQLWPEAGTGYRALVAEPAKSAVGTCLVWHGNAGSARQREYLAAPLLRQGWRVVVAEYPGYGARPSGSWGEAALIAEAKALAGEVRQRFGEPLVFMGESLGAAFAAAVAGDPAIPSTGVILLTPWHDLASVARWHYPWVPVGLLLRNRFDSAAALRHYPGPVVVVTAGNDEIIPAAEGRRLYQALETPRKRLREIAASRHNDWLDRVSTEDWREWLTFVAGAPGAL